MTNLNSNQFREMYAEMGINIDKLGCIMLDVDGGSIESPPEQDLYFTINPDRFWIKGFVAGHTPHVTLLYGLMESGNTKWKWEVDKVLEGWEMKLLSIAHVGYFDSPYPDEPYYCIVAHLLITPELLEGHKRLEFLPHINTFPDYKAHITLCYIKKDEAKRDALIRHYNETLTGKTLPVIQLNYGK